MSAANSSAGGLKQSAPGRRWGWYWFVGGFTVGFAVVFVGMFLFYSVIAMHPSGQYLVIQPLWGFYAEVLPRIFGPQRLGPASINRSILEIEVFKHLALSAAAGCVVGTIGWLLGRFLRTAEHLPAI